MTTFISILIFAWHWNEWLWPMRDFDMIKIDFYWSLASILYTAVAGLCCFVGSIKFKDTTVFAESITGGVLGLIGQF